MTMISLLPSRRASHPVPALIPFREQNSRAVHYAPNPSIPPPHLLECPSSNSVPYSTSSDQRCSGEADDCLPLIPRTIVLPQDAYQHFTATGGPLQAHKTEMGHMFTAPVLLPVRYTDESIIPAIVTGVLRSPSKSLSYEGKKLRLLKKVLGEKKTRDEHGHETITKVVFMPRREYLRSFAKDKDGVYVGSEPWRQWSEEELETEFGRFKPEVRVRRGSGGRRSVLVR